MKSDTTLQYIGGSWYARIPAAYTEHMKLNDQDKKNGGVPGEIQDEVNKDAHPFVSIWKKGT
jgi:hypothetical protein